MSNDTWPSWYKIRPFGVLPRSPVAMLLEFGSIKCFKIFVQGNAMFYHLDDQFLSSTIFWMRKSKPISVCRQRLVSLDSLHPKSNVIVTEMRGMMLQDAEMARIDCHNLLRLY